MKSNTYQSSEETANSVINYRYVAEALPHIIWIVDPQGKIMYVNRQWEEWSGIGMEELHTGGWKQVYHPEDQVAIQKQWKKAFETGEELKWEYRMKNRQGTYSWFMGQVSPIYDSQGNRIFWLGSATNIDDQKKVQEALKESEQKYRLVVENGHDIITLLDLNGTILYTSPSFKRVLGFEQTDLLGKNAFTLIHPDDREKSQKEMVKALRGEVGITIFRMQNKKGEWRIMEGSGSAILNEKNEPTFVISSSRDVTERKIAEDQLKQLAEIVESSDDAILSTDIKGKITSWNKGAEKLYGYTAEEAVGKSLSFLIPTKKKDDFPKIIERVKKGKSIDHYETQRVTKDKRLIEISLTVSPIKGDNGKIIGASKIARDITERKRSEDNLKFLSEASKILASSLDYQVTLNSIAKLAVPKVADWCAIDLLNENGGLTQVAVVHKDPKKVKWAKELRKAQPPDMNAPNGLPQVIRTGKSELYPEITDEMLVRVAKNKKELKLARTIGFTSAMIVPLTTEGKPIGGITFVTTETKRHYHENDLKMAEELAARASLALENAGLYKASQDAILLRDNFISVASHELKTPVTSVKIFTQILQKHSEQIGDEKAIVHLKKMDKQLNKLIELIYDLLNVSKIQAGRMEFNQQEFDFDTSIKEIVDVLQEGSERHTLQIKGKTGKKVYGDEERIGQVVSNLISNAIKYSPKADKVVIHLSADKKNVVVCVEDFGIGLSTEHYDKIFDRFYRVFDNTDKTFPGLGIGLYICSEIIKRHHGKLWVESDTGKGSKFYFSLPLERKEKLQGVQVL